MFLLIICVHVESVVLVNVTTTTAGIFVVATTFVGFFEVVIVFVFASFTIVDFDFCDDFLCWFLPVAKGKFGVEFDVKFDVEFDGKFDVEFLEFSVVENLIDIVSIFVKIRSSFPCNVIHCHFSRHFHFIPLPNQRCVTVVPCRRRQYWRWSEIFA